MKSIFQSLSERIGRQARRRPASAKKRRNACLQLESLEDRTVPTTINLFPIPTPSSLPTAITAGPDGNLWFTESQANQIGSINPTTHAIQEFKIPQGLNGPAGITVGPDSNLWFTLTGNSQLCQFNPTTHVFHQFPIGAPALNLTTAPNDAFEDGYPVLWLTEPTSHQVEVFDTTVNKVTEPMPFGPSDQPWAITSDAHGVWATDLSGGIYHWSFLTSPASQSAWPVPTANSEPTGITVDGSGNAWFTELGTNQVGMVNPGSPNVTEFAVPTVNGQNGEPYAITLGPDGNLWFTEFMSIPKANGSFANYIGMINPTTHAITQFELPLAPGAAGAGAEPAGITPGPDGNIWFVEKGIIASEEHPQTGNAVGEVVLGNGKGMKAVGGLVPQALVQLNAGTVPPQALVRFSAEPIFTQMITGGPTGASDLSFPVQGQFSDSGQSKPAAGPSAMWSLAASYNLEVHVHLTWQPPEPISPLPGSAETSGPVVFAPGSLTADYTIDGQVHSILTVSQTGDQPQTIIHTDHEDLTENVLITGTILPPVPWKGQEIDFVSQATSIAEDSGTVVRKLPGLKKPESITLERGVIDDQAFENWRQTLEPWGPWGSTAVRAITAAFSTTDQLDETLLLVSKRHPPEPIHIAAVLTAGGSVSEYLFPPQPIMPAEAPFGLTGASEWQGQLTETISHPSAPVHPPQPITETTQAQGDFAMKFRRVHPPEPFTPPEPLTPVERWAEFPDTFPPTDFE
jgi:streptogramin lyase